MNKESHTDSDESFIAGKDASLEHSIAHMQQQLETLGFHVEEHSWLNPLPHVWSVHIRDRDCPQLFTNGKGASKKAALASALGEFFERLATNYFWADYYLGGDTSSDTKSFLHYSNERWFSFTSKNKQENKKKNKHQWPEGLLSEELINFYDPDNELKMDNLVDINSADIKRGICALPYTRQRDNKDIWFPVSIIGNLYVSNGMSAGNTPSEARVQALSEIFERHVKFKIIEEGICLPDVPQSVIDQYPTIKEGIEKLEEKGFGVLVKDASLGGRYPVINVTLLTPQNQGCFASFGAHPKFEIALERSLTELLQGRELNALNEFPAPIHDLDEVASQENIETHFIDSSGLMSWQFLKNSADYEFSQCDFKGSTKEGTTEEEFEWLCKLIHDSGRDIYIADYSHLGVYACRILVPSMSEIYPCDDLIWANNNNGISIREKILALQTLSPDDAIQLLSAIEEHNIDDLQLVAALVGIPPQKNTLWSDFRVAELNVLLSAIAGQTEQVIQGCEWLLSFGQLEDSRTRLYHCIHNLLTENMNGYSNAFEKLYPDTVIKQAKALIKGKLQGLEFENSLHESLIQAYRKLHSTKAIQRQSDKAE